MYEYIKVIILIGNEIKSVLILEFRGKGCLRLSIYFMLVKRRCFVFIIYVSYIKREK